MHNTSNTHIKLAATIIFLMYGTTVAAEEKLFTGSLAASQLWDSNFLREPIAVSEQITLLSAGVGLSTNISRQRLSLGWRVRSYQHAENEKFDETIQDGLFRWSGAWGEDITTNLEWARDTYLVDRWEAAESDAVAKDDAKFVVAYGSQNRFGFELGARNSQQNHSSEIYENLDYEENEGFAGLTYKTHSQSTLTLRYREGDRSYINRAPDDVENNFDFDYRQFELENIWKISAKTTSTFTVARFEREGAINNSSGDFALLDFNWEASPKVQWHLGYSYKRPVQGETIDMPACVQTAFVGASWQVSSKINVSSRVEKLKRYYEDDNEQLTRIENQYNLIPLSVSYKMYDSLSIRLDTSWRKNESPELEREYKALQVMLGLSYRF